MRGFEVANEYAEKFELFREFFAENEEFDVEALSEEEHGENNNYNLLQLLINSLYCHLPM